MRIHPDEITLCGAYGRATEMADWDAGKDFKIIGGPYCSNRDVELMKAHGIELLVFVDFKGNIIDRITL